MYIIMNADVAAAVRGKYGAAWLMPCRCVGGYYLPADVLENQEYKDAAGILATCEIVDSVEAIYETE